jgi:hypothetical protein
LRGPQARGNPDGLSVCPGVAADGIAAWIAASRRPGNDDWFDRSLIQLICYSDEPLSFRAQTMLVIYHARKKALRSRGDVHARRFSRGRILERGRSARNASRRLAHRRLFPHCAGAFAAMIVHFVRQPNFDSASLSVSNPVIVCRKL